MKYVRNILMFIIVLLIMILPLKVNANILCKDGTVSPSCGNCHRGCCSHHGGCATSGSFSGGSVTKKKSIKSSPKSSDKKIESLYIDNKKISLDDLSYSTYESSVDIRAILSDLKASYVVKNNNKLVNGKNIVSVIVTAEDGSTKKYNITVNKMKKSSDTSLNYIKINNQELDLNNLYYQTTDSGVTIIVNPKDSKASYKVQDNNNLVIGNNKTKVIVEAQDGTTKEYIINVERIKKLSNNTDIKLIIDNKEISFNGNKSKINVNYNKENIAIKYEISDINTLVNMNEVNPLKLGDNELYVNVIAEDGTAVTYTIIIHRLTKTEEILPTIVGLGSLGGISFVVLRGLKKIKKV